MRNFTDINALKSVLHYSFQDLSEFQAANGSDATAILVRKLDDSIRRCTRSFRPTHIRQSSRPWIDASIVRLS